MAKKKKAAKRSPAKKRKTTRRRSNKTAKKTAAKKAAHTTAKETPPPEAERPPVSASEQADRRLAAAALRKIQAGQKPSRDEHAALRRVESKEEERRRWEYYKTIPQKHWRLMSGRQPRTINEQAERYGLPFGGPSVDLTDLVPRLHNFLAQNARALATASQDEDGLLVGPKTASLERLRKAQAEKVEMQNATTRRQLVPADEVHQVFALIANCLRGAADELVAEHGESAYEILATAISTAEDMLQGLRRSDGGKVPRIDE